MNKPKTETFFLVRPDGKYEDFNDDILGAVQKLKKIPKGAVIRSDGIIMAGDPKATAAAEAGEFQPVPWGKTRKPRYDVDDEDVDAVEEEGTPRRRRLFKN